MSNTLKKLAIGGLFAATATGAMAATQGTTGATSQGDLDITMTVVDGLNISNLVDIPLGLFSGADMVGTSPACIYRNGAVSTYQVTASGSGAGGLFTLANGATTVPYSVEYDDTPAVPSYASMAVGSPLVSTGATGFNDLCVTNGGNNAGIRVTVLAADAATLATAIGGYTGTLTLLVAPN